MQEETQKMIEDIEEMIKNKTKDEEIEKKRK